MKYVKLFENWAEPKIKIGTYLFPKNQNIEDEKAIFSVQCVIKFLRNANPVMTKVRFTSNSSGSNQWTIQDWNGERDGTAKGVLKHFDILSRSDFEKIVSSSEYLQQYDKDKLMKEYDRKNAINKYLKQNV